MDRLTIFWILMAATVVLFLWGLAANVAIYRRGRGGPSANGALPDLRFGRVLRALLADGLLHRALLRESKWRWAAHTLFAIAFLLLFALSAFTGFFEEILRRGFGVETPFVLAVVDKDTPIMALLNEALGIPLLVGWLALVIRRYVLRPAQLRTEADDTWVLALLGIGLLTGYPTESLRLLAEGITPTAGHVSFIGYPLAQALRPLGLAWEQWHFALFFIHVLPFMALLVYMPYSKFFHAVMGPIVATVNALRREETR
ncbi:MAG: respiratory nitrate reductase subunit gamma [Anaerolineae bacterium]|nr:respiratory nitrate reductase subunit gamma [Anaerolineae bacterium]